jgi:integrase
MFLHKRPGSDNWQLEIKFPKDYEFWLPEERWTFNNRKHFTKSLGTSDKAEAEIKALPYIHSFRIALFGWKNRPTLTIDQRRSYEVALSKNDFDAADLVYARAIRDANNHFLQYNFGSRYEDGLQEIDGSQVFVSGKTITYFDHTGKVLRTAENPHALRYTAPLIDNADVAAAYSALFPGFQAPDRFMATPKNPDSVRDVRYAWELYKTVVAKPLAKATRKDAKELLSAMRIPGRAAGTVRKKMGLLSAACVYAIDEELLISNPFSRIAPAPQKHEIKKRLSLTEEHMAACHDRLVRLKTPDALLWRLFAKTGMRLGEAMSIDRDYVERGSGIRYVHVGTKTDSSERNVPLPTGIGLPERIDRQLFDGGAPAASKRLNRFIKSCVPGAGRDLVVHSLRHRMIDVLQMVWGDEPYLRRRLVGHAAADVHDRYGSFGPPMDLLEPMIVSNRIDGTQRFRRDERPKPVG